MVVSQPRSPEPPRSTRRGRGACPRSSRERTSKARMAFLVAPLARVDGECMVLDDPALIFTCCHSALAARAATGALTVTAVTLRVVRKYLRVPDLGTGFELDGSELKIALLTLQGVLKYARIFLTPTQSLGSSERYTARCTSLRRVVGTGPIFPARSSREGARDTT